MLRGARAGKLDPNRVIESSVDILIDGVNEDREHWRFIGRERSSGVTVLRYAIRTEIRLITSELAIDLARFPGLNTWSGEDLNILASLFVNSMIVIAEAIEDANDPAAIEEIKRTAVKQLRMIAVGVSGWRSAETSVRRMPHLELTYPRPDIAVLTLNRPEKLNALNYELVEELHAALDGIGANNDCRVVVLTGAGRGFCSGLDLTDPNPHRRAAAPSSRGRACAGRNASRTSPRGYTVFGSR